MCKPVLFGLICSIMVAAGANDPPESPPPAGQPGSRTSVPDTLDAERLLRTGLYAQAARQFEAQPLTDDRTRINAWIGLMRCRLALGQYAAAEKLVVDGKAIVETDARALYWAGRLAYVQGRYEDAVTACRRAIALDPKNAPARLLLGTVFELTGQREKALEAYRWFDGVVTTVLPDDAADLTAVGRGFYRYSTLIEHPNLVRRTRHVLSQIYQGAYERLDRTYWPARVASADLLREKYNVDEARTDYQAALQINSNAVPALVGLGRLALDAWAFEKVDQFTDRALSINEHDPGALHLVAASRLVERRYHDAVAACDKALSVNPRDIEALSLAAAADLAMDDDAGLAATKQRIEAINPACSLFHRIVADVLGGLRRFEDGEKHYRLAIEYEPSAPGPRIELGLMYMQWGDEKKARDALDGAWRLDPFNERTKNTLELLDRLDAFESLATDHFIVRVDGAKDGLIAPMISNYLESIYDDVCDDFGASLKRRTIVELFPSHSEFAVRITGKPWIHTVGACTGWVIAVESPRRGADSSGPYDLGNVLRHEFTHTVTLAVTNNRIPHWMTEGLAVHEEYTDRGFSWMQMLARAVRRHELFTLDAINWAFMRPKKPWHRQLAYAQSEWMCEYLITTYGYDMIERMLAGFAEGKTQAAVFEQIVGVDEKTFDDRFAQWARAQAAQWGMDLSPVEDVATLRAQVDDDPQNATLHARLARAYYDTADYAQACDEARTSVTLDGDDKPAAWRVLVRALMAQAEAVTDKDQQRSLYDEALLAGEKLLAIAPDDATALRAVSRILLDRKFVDLAREHLLRLRRVQPLDSSAARRLAGIELLAGDDDAALVQLLDVVRHEEFDAQPHRQLAAIYRRAGRLTDARFWLNRALLIDPYASDVRADLAETLMRMGDTQSALEQYEALCRLAPQVAGYWAHAAMAHHQLGHQQDAIRCAKRAVKLDPKSPAATLLE